MRILAIRGANLASLADEFEIDLCKDPLAGAGLFAITGDTGAGKSTILDALCLALYGEFPRVAIERKEAVRDPSGRELSAKDARAILRRGAGHGYAEVDFLGQDGKGYRARWEVRRARGRADGNLQDAERRLLLLSDDSAIATGKTDVKEAIEARTELTFDQFRRTVLLAQGEFDTFLLAAENDRAELLEKITGTDIYARISKHVNAGAKEREARARALEDRRADVGLMDEETRDALIEEHAKVSEALGLRNAELSELNGQLDHARRSQRAREEADKAAAALAEARQRLEEASHEVHRLQLLDDAETLRAKAETRQVTRVRLNEAQLSALEAKRQLADAEERVTSAGTSLAAATDASARAESEVERFTPIWREAERADLAVAHAMEALEAAQKAADGAQRQLEEGGAELAKLDAAIADADQRFAHTLQRLEADKAHAPLADQLEQITKLFERRSSFRQREAEIKREQAETSREEERLQLLTAATSDALAKFARQRGEIGAQLNERRQALSKIAERSLTKRDDRVGLFVDLLREAREVAQIYDRADATRADAYSTIAEQDAALAAAIEELTTAEARFSELTARRSEATSLLDLAEAVESQHAAAMRSVLVDGEPCPVCGAAEHPFTANTDPETEVVARFRARRAELDIDIDSEAKIVADARRRQETARARGDVARSYVSEATAQIDRAIEAFAELLPKLTVSREAAHLSSPLPDSLSSQCEKAIAALMEEAAQARSELRKPLEMAKALRAECDGLQRQLDETASKQEAAVEQSKTDSAALTSTQNRLTQLLTHLAHLHEQIGSTDRELAPHLASAGLTSEDVDRNASHAQQHVARLATSFAKLRDESRLLEAELQQIERKQFEARSRWQIARAEFEKAVAARAEGEKRLQQTGAARSALLAGEPTDTHRSRLLQAAKEAEASLEHTRQASSESKEALAARQARLEAVTKHVEACAGEFNSAESAFSSALAQIGMTEDDALALLAIAAEERRSLREKVDKLRRDATEWATALSHRRRDVADIQSERESEADIGAITATVAQVTGEIEECRNRLAAMNAKLEADNEARTLADDLTREIAIAREELAHWKSVDDAVGSADGNKFRRFAQGVTLDQLVGLANEQLAGLNPRYLLQRGETADLVLHIVDRDMGDEVRSLRSLSGGERFLVSLALALALSGLEGRQSFVDTLFIDEGFGALDAETLDVAIDALETLHGHGRKVGVITHVAAMVERIAVQIRVEKRGGGRGVIRIADADAYSEALAALG